MHKIRKSSYTKRIYHKGKHRPEHWYVDSMTYFITARCCEKYPAFEIVEAQHIFWDRFDHYTKKYEFTPWICTLMNNHYHYVGFNRHAENVVD